MDAQITNYVDIDAEIRPEIRYKRREREELLRVLGDRNAVVIVFDELPYLVEFNYALSRSSSAFGIPTSKTQKCSGAG